MCAGGGPTTIWVPRAYARAPPWDGGASRCLAWRRRGADVASERPRTQPGGRDRPGRGSKARRITRDGVPWSELPRIDACTVAAELCAPSRQLRHSSLALQRAACLAVLAVGRGAKGVAAMDVRAALGLAAAQNGMPAECSLAIRRWCSTVRSPGGMRRPVSRACGDHFSVLWLTILGVLDAACARVGARPLTEVEWRSARWIGTA